MKFTQVSSGHDSTDIIITSNSKTDSILTLQIISNKDSVLLKPSLNLIDLGILNVNESKDTIFSIRNVGSVTTSGYLIFPEGFNADISTFSILKGDSSQINLHFAGYANDTIINDLIIITDSICGRAEKINIKVQIKQPQDTINQTTIICEPNPATDIMKFVINVAKDGYTELIIRDFLGNTADRLFVTDKAGLKIIDYNLALLSSGIYCYYLQAPTGRLSGLFIVVK
jgi:hypothetical protein